MKSACSPCLYMICMLSCWFFHRTWFLYYCSTALSVCLPAYLPVCLFLFVHVCLSLSLYPSISLSLFNSLYISLSIYLLHSFGQEVTDKIIPMVVKYTSESSLKLERGNCCQLYLKIIKENKCTIHLYADCA